MKGLYDNFPENLHRIDNFESSVPKKKLQQKLIETLHEMNSREFSSEETGQPALHGCTIIFEAGAAELKSFSFIDDEEAKKLQKALEKLPFQVLDFFFAIRYYKNDAEKRTPLRFDYYLLRTVFGENSMEMRVFHERGPRYISPEDLVTFMVDKINGKLTKKLLKRIESTEKP
jgi:hypothetical protein